MIYPLSSLSSVLSGKGHFKIFPNQIIMFRTLITFSSNKLNPIYGKNTTDELLPSIHQYLYSTYMHQPKEMSSLHRCICQNLLEPINYIEHFNNSYGSNRHYLSLSNSTLNAGNINKTFSGKRFLPTDWISTYCQNKDNPEAIIQRIFWILQYFCVYYCSHENSILRASTLSSELSPSATTYIEYFQLVKPFKNHLILELKSKCAKLSPLINELSEDNFDFHILARIIWDILGKHYLQSQAEKLVYSIPQAPAVPYITPNKTQFEVYQSQIAIYGPKTIDRFHRLTQYATQNIYAAHELSNIYFYGETFVFEGGSNYYYILPDYKKSAEYCTLAINNSNPTYSPACWSLGYLIYTGFYTEYEKDPAKLTVAKYYFEKAGHYAPAYNSLAQIYIREADSIYNSMKHLSKDLIKKYVMAMEFADKAANLGWIYGNNIIADFIERHWNDKKLLSAIANSAHLTIPFDYEQQLLTARKSNNPWTIHSLAVYYINTERKELALPLLHQVAELNYNKAYYTLFTITDDYDKAYAYLLQSSYLGYPNATYQLALYEYEKGKHDRYYELLLSAKQQNLAMPKIDLELQREINERLK